jgi:hypothetical protein
VDINGLEEKVKTLRRQQSTYQDHLSCVSRCDAPASSPLLRTRAPPPHATVRARLAPYGRGAPSCRRALVAGERAGVGARWLVVSGSSEALRCGHELCTLLLRVETVVWLTVTLRATQTQAQKGLGRHKDTAERHGGVARGVMQAVAPVER